MIHFKLIQQLLYLDLLDLLNKIKSFSLKIFKGYYCFIILTL